MIKTFPTLYKKTSTGKTQIWYMEIEGSQYRTISGQKDGKKTTSGWTQAEGTNIGRANERSPEQQAEFEVAATYKKKLEKDYHETENAAQSEGSKIYECMLAESYSKRLEKKVSAKNPLFEHKGTYSQPKLDGMRCIAKADGLWTRNGKPIISCPHIVKALAPVFKQYPDAVLDGELYNHEFKADFNEIISIFKQQKPDEEDFKKAAELGEYHLYDMPTALGHDVERNTNRVFSNRFKQLQWAVNFINNPMIKLVRTDLVESKEHLDRLYEEYLEEGYEGQMVRENTPYENDRTWSLLKRKEFFDAEYELVDIQPGLGNWAGAAKRAILKTEDGREFGAGITGPRDFCREVLMNKDKYIGKITTVNYTNFTPDGIPRFGRVKELNRIDV